MYGAPACLCACKGTFRRVGVYFAQFGDDMCGRVSTSVLATVMHGTGETQSAANS